MKNFITVLFLLITTFITLPAQVQIGMDFLGSGQYDSFGISVSLSSDGQTLAIGAPEHNGGLGQVKVYQNQSGSWVQIGDPIDGTTIERFGYSVSLSSDGEILAIGALDGNTSGQVMVFQNQSSIWMPIGDPIDGTGEDDQFGYSVSLSSDGQTLAIGARFYNSSAGQVKIFQNQSGNWVPVGDPIDGTGEYSQFGYSVSLSSDGQTLAIGAPTYNSGSGQVKVFQNQSENWILVGDPLDGTTDSSFGESVSLSSDGQTLGIGAPTPNDIGQVMVFKNQSGSWVLIGDPIDGTEEGSRFGSSVSLSSNGEILAIGASAYAHYRGQVEIYKNESNMWRSVNDPIEGDSEEGVFGHSVSLSSDGKTIAIGAPGDDNSTGLVKVFGEFLVSTFKIADEEVKLYPNPTTSTVNFEGKSFDQIVVMDLQGRVLQVETNPDSFIDLSTLLRGIYFLRFTFGEETATARVVKL